MASAVDQWNSAKKALADFDAFMIAHNKQGRFFAECKVSSRQKAPNDYRETDRHSEALSESARNFLLRHMDQIAEAHRRKLVERVNALHLEAANEARSIIGAPPAR